MAYQNEKVKARQTVKQSTSQTKELGIVSEVPMGEWNATTQYQKLNKVRYVSTGGSGVTLLAKKQNQGIEPFVAQGWQEVWMVENYDGGAVSPDGTYPEMSVGNATNTQNDGNGQNIAEQFSDITAKIPSSASADNQLAPKDFVNSSINNMAAFYITYNSSGDAFPTREDLLNATTFYSGGQERVPTQNDYAIVLADESQPVGVDGTHPTTRYSYQGGTYPDGQWDFQYVVNNTSLTQAQVDAINSGITAQKIVSMDAATAAKYTKPSGGIPESDLSANVQSKLNANSSAPIKNLYNLGAFDIYQSNGDGTVTVSRKTGYREYSEGDVLSFATWSGYPVALVSKPVDFIGYGNFESYSLPNNLGFKSGSVPDQPNAIFSRGDAPCLGVMFAVGTSQDVMRKTIDGLIIQYQLATKYQYEEQVIDNQPIHHLNQEGENWVDNEFKKGLNSTPIGQAKQGTNILLTDAEVGTYTLVTYDSGNTQSSGVYGMVYPGGEQRNIVNGRAVTFTTTQVGNISIYLNAEMGTPYVMLTRGTIVYPYVPYHGKIVREKDIKDVYSQNNPPILYAANLYFSSTDLRIQTPPLAVSQPDSSLSPQVWFGNVLRNLGYTSRNRGLVCATSQTGTYKLCVIWASTSESAPSTVYWAFVDGTGQSSGSSYTIEVTGS